MRREQILTELLAKPKLMKVWRDLVESGDMHDILRVCQCFKYPYTEDTKESEIPHVQSERNGGMKAWGKLEYNLITLPSRQDELHAAAEGRPRTYQNDIEDKVFIRDSSLPKPSHERFKRKFTENSADSE